jgi:hypothetical protein
MVTSRKELSDIERETRNVCCHCRRGHSSQRNLSDRILHRHCRHAEHARENRPWRIHRDGRAVHDTHRKKASEQNAFQKKKWLQQTNAKRS